MTGISPTSVAAGDLDGDSDVDLAVANSDDGKISLFFNNGDATFDVQSVGSGGDQPVIVKIVDLNGDGFLDLVVDLFPDKIALLFNGGKGNF